MGESSPGKSPGNPAVTSFPSRSRYRRASEAPRRAQRSALTTAPGVCPLDTDTLVASIPVPAAGPSSRDRPDRSPRHPVAPTLSHGPGHARGAATCSWWCRGGGVPSGLELRPRSPPWPPPRLQAPGSVPAAPVVLQAAPLRPLCAPRCAWCAQLAPQPPALVLPGRGGGAGTPTCSAGFCPGAAAAAQRAGTRPGRAGSLGNPGGGSQPPGVPLRDTVPSPSCGETVGPRSGRGAGDTRRSATLGTLHSVIHLFPRLSNPSHAPGRVPCALRVQGLERETH